MDLKIRDYLEHYNPATRRGKCNSCQKDITWKRESLISHKRASCSVTGKNLFFEKFPQWRLAKYAISPSSSNSNASGPAAAPSGVEDDEIVLPEELDDAIGLLFILRGRYEN